MDKHYKSALVLFSACLLSITTFAQDAYLENVAMGRYVKTNTNYAISASVRNATDIPITQFRVGWRWNNGTVNLGPVINVGGGGIVSNNYMSNTNPVQLNIPTQGEGTLKVWVKFVGDSDTSNDTITISMTAIENWAVKTVLLEAKTATWCPQCPPCNTVTNTISADPNVAIAKFHPSDDLSVASGTEYLSANMNVSYTPAGLIDQGEYGAYEINFIHTRWEAEVDARTLSVAPVSVSMSPTFNATTRVLNLPVTANFTYAEEGEYTMNAYVLEDNIVNYQNNGGAGNNYVHHHVVRAVLGGASGTADLIPASPVVNTPYSHEFTYTLPNEWVASNIRLVAYVTKRNDNGALTLNAAKASMLPVGIGETADLQASMKVFPNPLNEEGFYISLSPSSESATVEMFAADGRRIQQWQRVFSDVQYFDDLGSLATGTYLLRVQRGEATATFKLTKN
ncbi:MAG: Omp28-related outer membrane protein [Flavobacteriales bacterium]|nr:Omp28-related outer membrane protein [Flavobacteriales bacterium]